MEFPFLRKFLLSEQSFLLQEVPIPLVEGLGVPDSMMQVFATHVYGDVAAAGLLGAGEVSSQHEQLQTKPKKVGQLFCVLPVFPTEKLVAFHTVGVLASYHYCQIH